MEVKDFTEDIPEIIRSSAKAILMLLFIDYTELDLFRRRF